MRYSEEDIERAARAYFDSLPAPRDAKARLLHRLRQRERIRRLRRALTASVFAAFVLLAVGVVSPNLGGWAARGGATLWTILSRGRGGSITEVWQSQIEVPTILASEASTTEYYATLDQLQSAVRFPLRVPTRFPAQVTFLRGRVIRLSPKQAYVEMVFWLRDGELRVVQVNRLSKKWSVGFGDRGQEVSVVEVAGVQVILTRPTTPGKPITLSWGDGSLVYEVAGNVPESEIQAIAISMMGP